MSDPIASTYVMDVCKLGGGEACCAFLAMGSAFECAKGTGAEPVIRLRLKNGSMGAKGDNCEGWAAVRGTP